MKLSLEIQHFIEDNIDLIENNNFLKLYTIASEELEGLSKIGELSVALLSCDIEVLKYTEHEVPEGFYYKFPISNAIIPEGIETISHSAFAFCDKLTELTLPKSLTVIRSFVFDWCTNLRVINWNATNLMLCDYTAFRRCTDLRKIIFAGTMDDWTRLARRCKLRFADDAHFTVKCSDGIIEWDKSKEI